MIGTYVLGKLIQVSVGTILPETIIIASFDNSYTSIKRLGTKNWWINELDRVKLLLSGTSCK